MGSDFKPSSKILFVFLLSASVSLFLYKIFLHFSVEIWSVMNAPIKINEMALCIRGLYNDRDGIEGYVLYSMMFLNIGLTYAAYKLINRIKNEKLNYTALGLMTALTIFYFIIVGFFPPNVFPKVPSSHFVLPEIFTICLIVFLNFIDSRFNHYSTWIFAILLLPICFVAYEQVSTFDYAFTLAPAMRLIQGVPIHAIYFQYDLLISLIAALWLKLGLKPYDLQIIGMISAFAFLLGMYIFSKQYFLEKKLSIYFFALLLLVRYFGLYAEISTEFQMTPLRLDLWLILLFVAYKKGVHHYSTGITLGLLYIFHRNFGFIYCIAYFELIGILFALDVIKEGFRISIKKHLLLNWKSLTIIGVSIIISAILFHGFLPESALHYQFIGIGMMKISPYSFYWYMPILYSMAFTLLLILRKQLSLHYFNIGLFIIFIAIGNSLYFFGRSHENNIIKTSANYILVFFLVLDLIQNLMENSTKFIRFRNIFLIALLLTQALFAGQLIKEKITIKAWTIFKRKPYIQTIKRPEIIDIEKIHRLTKNSDKVYFLDIDHDVEWNYYAGYKLVGYYQPCAAWVVEKERIQFLQKLLDENYYIATTDTAAINDITPLIHYNQRLVDHPFTVYKKN